MSDILFKSDELVFSYRVGGILRRGNKILLQRPVGDDYSVIGGHVRALETSRETLAREFSEELKTAVKVGELFAIGEIFFPWGSRPCHQISLYYNVTLPEDSTLPGEGSFPGYDESDVPRDDMEFVWVDIEELRRGVKMYPEELVPHIINPKEGIVHFVSKQIKI